ncbi:MAG: hypothetical protein KDA60_15275 [Planctomycetales bacterium]|nr:hypothetical protein [Planctomycetales bacterium]
MSRTNWLAILLCMAWATTAQAESPKWNPFPLGKKANTATAAELDDATSVTPTLSETKRIARASFDAELPQAESKPFPEHLMPEVDPSPIEEVHRNAQGFFSRTKEVLTPPKLPTPSFSAPKLPAPKFTAPKLPTPKLSLPKMTRPEMHLSNPFKRGEDRQSGATPPRQKLFGNWFQREEEPPKPLTVSDFIGKPRPGIDD